MDAGSRKWVSLFYSMYKLLYLHSVESEIIVYDKMSEFLIQIVNQKINVKNYTIISLAWF